RRKQGRRRGRRGCLATRPATTQREGSADRDQRQQNHGEGDETGAARTPARAALLSPCPSLDTPVVKPVLKFAQAGAPSGTAHHVWARISVDLRAMCFKASVPPWGLLAMYPKTT